MTVGLPRTHPQPRDLTSLGPDHLNHAETEGVPVQGCRLLCETKCNQGQPWLIRCFLGGLAFHAIWGRLPSSAFAWGQTTPVYLPLFPLPVPSTVPDFIPPACPLPCP